MKNKFFKKPEAIPFIIFNIFITFVFILLLFSVCDSVHAADYQDYFPMSQNKNGLFTSSVISTIEYEFDSENNLIFCKYSVKQNQYNLIYLAFVPRSSDTALYGEIYNDLIHFDTYKIGSGNINYRLIYIQDDGYLGGTYYSDASYFQNNTSSNYSSSADYVSNYQIYTNNTSSQKKVLMYGSQEEVTVPGTATRPDKQERMDFLHNNRPDHVPDPPTINNYSWTVYNPPSIDTSSLENILESLLNRTDYNFSYLFSNLGGIFSNLISNIGSFFEYLGELISYGFDVVVNNIIAGIENFYDNMVSLFEPLFESVNSISSFIAAFYELGLGDNGSFSVYTLFSNVISYLFIPDPEDLSDLLVSHDIYGIIDLAETTQNNVNYINSLITAGDNLYIITLSEFTILGVTCGPYNIDFSWYLPLKNAGDSIISAFLVLGWFMWLYFRLPYWLRGQQGDITHLTKEVNK